MSRNNVMTSFENLVALANYRETLRDARKMVWRDRGEPTVKLHTIEECLLHAARGGVRAGAMGFTLRSGFNFFVLLFRIWRMPKHFRFSLIRHALLGEDSFRFAAMLGTFAALYKFILNSLPLLFPQRPRSTFSPDTPGTPYDELPVTMAPTPSERRRGRLSFRAQAHEEIWRKQSRKWYALVAGAIAGGLGVLFEKKGRRVTIAQQLFVRGLQGSYNALSNRYKFKIPHGEALVFALSCGQIMYASLLRPDTLPPSYSQWIHNASHVPKAALRMNQQMVREGSFNFDDLKGLIILPFATPKNREILKERLINAQACADFGPHYATCDMIHPWLDSCIIVSFERILQVARWMLPVYGALHLVPAVLFKWKVFVKNPWHVLARAALGTARSSAFLGVFVAIYQAFLCIKNNLIDLLLSPNSPLPFKLTKDWANLLYLHNKPIYYIGGLLSGLSLFVEEKRRRGELAMYVLPKGLESAWIMARGKGLVFRTGQYGEALLCAIGMGLVMNTYQNNPQHLSGLVRRIMYQFIGPN